MTQHTPIRRPRIPEPAAEPPVTHRDLGVEAPRHSPLTRLQQLLHAQSTIGSAAVLVLLLVVFSIWAPSFLGPANLSLMLQQTMIIGTLAVGQTLVILTAGIDLSVGAVMALSSTVMAKTAHDMGFPGWLALLAGLVIGTLAGLGNGVLVSRVKLPPFIVTLGTMNIFWALHLWYSQSQTVRGAELPDLLTWTGQLLPVAGTNVAFGSLLLIALVGVMAYVLRLTGWGRHVYATGDDAEASRLSGIRTGRVLLSVYAVAGLIYAIAGWVLIGRAAGTDPQTGLDMNLDSITAVVIGGTSLFGGRGSIVGTLIGALIVGVSRAGLSQIGVDVLWQSFAVGVLVIIAVTLDQWLRKVKA